MLQAHNLLAKIYLGQVFTTRPSAAQARPARPVVTRAAPVHPRTTAAKAISLRTLRIARFIRFASVPDGNLLALYVHARPIVTANLRAALHVSA